MRRKRKQKIKSESEINVKVLKDETKKKRSRKKVKKVAKPEPKKDIPKKPSGEYTLYCYSGQRFRFYLPLKTDADESKLPKLIRQFINSKKDELDLKYSNKITKVIVKEIGLKVRIR